MLTATLDALVDTFGAPGRALGEVAAGAVLKHSRDFNLTRESVLGSKLAPETPAYDVQQACGTGLEATVLAANKIALGQIDGGIAGGVDTTSDAPIAINEDLRQTLLESNRAKSNGRPAARARQDPSPADRPRDPAQHRAPYRAVDGRAPAIMAREWGIRARSRTSSPSPATTTSPPPTTPASSTTSSPVPRTRARPEPPPRLEPREARQAEARVRRSRRDDDRRQLDAAERRRLRRAAGQRGVGDGARHPRPGVHRRCPDRGRRPRPQARGAADGAGLRDPDDARAQRARARGLRLLRDPRGVRGAGAVHAEGLGGPVFCQERLGLRSRSGRSTATGSTSTAARSPPATRSARPAAGSSPGSRRCSPSGATAAAHLDLRRRRARCHRDHGGRLMTDRYSQLINTPIGRIVAKQVGLPRPSSSSATGRAAGHPGRCCSAPPRAAGSPRSHACSRRRRRGPHGDAGGPPRRRGRRGSRRQVFNRSGARRGRSRRSCSTPPGSVRGQLRDA